MPRNNTPPIFAVLGGTFDPCHSGHLSVLNQLQQNFNPNTTCVLPASQPQHKTQTTALIHRLAMLEKLLDQTTFTIDQTEIQYPSRGETIDTVQRLRQQHPEHNILWAMGDDIFATFHTWDRWQEIRNYCNIVVIQRTRPIYHEKLKKHLAQYHNDIETLRTHTHGHIYLANWDIPTISSTAIRKNPHQAKQQDQLTAPVYDYVIKHGLYDV